ncbi:hypothetical protein CON65_11435 [Bacillus pseudomycoides]|uniref:Uncharacterized protein n=1 Tax=Bacillus pseudomycoides TaxID=64104 RepID=A0AA91ZTA2_9BACI|nr:MULTISPECIES: hypothetical protein [Bacillus]PEB47526.1 hypothetical protein COO03_25660 [Bacillus sp. AFS098217]PED82555.1 hypothetical protein CON65_11435 [Bacillus pseudomycoides]PEU07773.1 hypothetical protein CN525_26440 [Bacillus sp. AFS014408]PEU17250.1 hypothetical protein CN524_02545 [Bacillus sp. AFS019443]
MNYCILKCVDEFASAYYNRGIKIYYILLLKKKGGHNMEIAMAILKFVGGVLPLVQELLKAFM